MLDLTQAQQRQSLPITKEQFFRLADGFSVTTEKSYERVVDANGAWVDASQGEEITVKIDQKTKDLWPLLKSEIQNKNHQRKRDALLRLALHKKPPGIGQASMGAYMDDLASDLAGFCALAIELACVHVRRSQDSPFFPQSKKLADLADAIQGRLQATVAASQPEPARVQIEKKGEYYNDPKENPLRRKLCDFLIKNGEPDLFEMTTIYSNYQLEMMARAKYAWLDAVDAA